MRAPALAVLVALALPSLAGAAPPRSGVVHAAVPPGTPLVKQGLQLYAGNCATCHGDRGQGIVATSTSRGAGAQQGAGPSLADSGALGADFYLRTGYMPLGHVGDEPHRSQVLFSDREIRALVAYVASLGKGPRIPKPHPERGDLSVGLRQFTEHCAGCHQVVAKGGYVTNAVAPALDRATPTQIAEAVRIGPYLMPRFSRRAISDAKLDSIIAYVQYAKHPADRGGWSIGRIGPVPEGLVAWLIAAGVLVAVCVVIGERHQHE
jgi:ubiquinol-cytochrome c reductase cytochrome c subunit